MLENALHSLIRETFFFSLFMQGDIHKFQIDFSTHFFKKNKENHTSIVSLLSRQKNGLFFKNIITSYKKCFYDNVQRKM